MAVPPFQESIKNQQYGQSASAQKDHAFVSRSQTTGHGSKTGKWLIGGGALLVVLGGFWYFNNDSGGAARGPRVTAAPIRVAKAERRDMAVVEHTIGTVVANTAVQVSARVQGVIVAAPFKEGQFVKKGDLLFQIDPRPYQAAYDNAVAAQATASAKAQRYSQLRTQNAIANQDYDDAQAAYLEAKATAEMARLNLEYTSIRSPVDGKTGPILVQPGNMIPATGTTVLVTINQIQPIKISFSLPQSDLPRIQARQKARGLIATIDQQDEGGPTLTAPVDFVSNNVNNTSGTIELRSTLDNSDDALVPGQLVDVVVQLNDIPGATVVPREAVNIGPDGQYVYVVSPDDKAIQQPVKLLFDNGTDAAIQGDVKPGDQVIVDGQLRVVPGAGVFVEGSKAKSGAGKGKGNGRRAGRNRG